MLHFRVAYLRAAALVAALALAISSRPAAAQSAGPWLEVSRLPEVNQARQPPEAIPPGALVPGAAPQGAASAPGGAPPPTADPAPGANDPADPPSFFGGGLFGNSVPLGQPDGPPPSQGQTAMAYGPSSELPWSWHVLPTGLMYRSYLAGVKEPRLGTAWLYDSKLGPRKDTRLDTNQVGTVWDSTLGGRVGILRYGTPNAYRPEGFQVDLMGSAQPRLNPYGDSTPLLACDYTVGIPVTFARGRWQYKTGYNHLSSHMGDELMINNPAFLAQRINYVRDSIMFGVGYFATDSLRLFGEVDYAVGLGGGSQPIELQCGADYSPARAGGAPFAAVYGNMRQELNYGGFFVVQAGWQWRGGLALSTFRIGMQYVVGQDTEWEYYNQFQSRIGWGVWYDF